MKPLVVIDGKPILYDSIERSVDKVMGDPVKGAQGRLWVTYSQVPGSERIRLRARSGRIYVGYHPVTQSVRPSGRVMLSASSKKAE